MTITIGLVANVFNEANALPGWLETHLPYFDDVRVTHAGPQGEASSDGTIELLEKWCVPIDFDSIDDGFGAVRTRAVHRSPCDYVMILDADERFYPVHRRMWCTGESTPHSEVDAILREYSFSEGRTPDWNALARLGRGLKVDIADTCDQGGHLRDILQSNPDSVATVRCHWHDFSFRRPTQNWHRDPDWQTRIVRRDQSIYFDPSTRMHERLVGATYTYRDGTPSGVVIDHFHFPFKRMEVDQRRHDVSIYDAIHAGKRPPTWDEFEA